MKILLLEDDLLLSDTIIEILEDEKHQVDSTVDGLIAEEMMIDNDYDLYLLDINVKNWNGLELAKYVRQEGDMTPIIFITALRDIENIKAAFKVGIIDYLKKPFDPEELLLRIEAGNNKTFSVNKKIHKPIEVNNVIYKNNMFFIDNEILILGKMESIVLQEFFINLNVIVSKEILTKITNNNNPNALRVLIKKIRDKTNLNIKGVRGEGYLLNEK
jgi:DNA-binding response OmpR family regulator